MIQEIADKIMTVNVLEVVVVTTILFTMGFVLVNRSQKRVRGRAFKITNFLGFVVYMFALLVAAYVTFLYKIRVGFLPMVATYLALWYSLIGICGVIIYFMLKKILPRRFYGDLATVVTFLIYLSIVFFVNWWVTP